MASTESCEKSVDTECIEEEKRGFTVASSRPPYPIPKDEIPCTRHAHLTIRYREGDGRGVYATSDIPCGTTVETSPFLILTDREIQETPLVHYTYAMTVVVAHDEQRRDDGTTSSRSSGVQKVQALALGLGSLFNHSDTPNVGWYMNKQEGYIAYRTTRDINKGEALEICYGDASWMPGYATSRHIQATTKDESDDDDDNEIQRDIFGIPLSTTIDPHSATT